MKETKKSLKIYFIAVSLLGFIGTPATIFGILMATDLATRVLLGVYLLLPITFFYYGIKLDYYLQKSPKTLITMVMISWIISIIIHGLSLNLTGIAISSLLGWYLIRSIKRLSLKESSI